MTRPRVGIALPGDAAFLARNRRLIEADAEVFEVSPDTLWRADGARDAMHAALLALVHRAERPLLGHGVLFGLGNAVPPPRREAWLRGLSRDQAAFGFAWLSEHLGFTDAGDRHTALALPLPCSEDGLVAAAAGLQALQRINPQVAFENGGNLFTLDDPLAEGPFFAELCRRTGAWLLLDLHNAYVTCLAARCDFARWLDALPWEHVIEVHLSGGSESEPAWLPSGRVLRLDSHDDAVPEPVWGAFAQAIRRAPHLRAVVLEWLPDAIDDGAAAALARDFARARSMLGGGEASGVFAAPPPRPSAKGLRPVGIELSSLQHTLVEVCRGRDPAAALDAARAGGDAATAGLGRVLAAVDADGLRTTALLLVKLRLERLLRADPAAAAAFAADPAAFAARFHRYCDAVPPTAVFPSEEAEAFGRFERTVNPTC